MPLSADATCTPHPVQVGSLHTTQVVLKHILLLNALLAAAGRTPSCSPGLAAEDGRMRACTGSSMKRQVKSSHTRPLPSHHSGCRLGQTGQHVNAGRQTHSSSRFHAPHSVAAAAATRARARREVPVVCCVAASHLPVAPAMNGSGARLKAAPERADEDGARQSPLSSSVVSALFITHRKRLSRKLRVRAGVSE